jgi:hypothetical protein
MNLKELKTCLQSRPELNLALALPDGRLVPAHFHVTEVGHVAKKFVDCGGTFRASEACVLQTHIGSSRDDGHRLTAGKLAKILDLAKSILPSGELPVEVEYEDGVISQFPLRETRVEGTDLTLQLGFKHTDCLAKSQCGIEEGDVVAGEVAGCCDGPGCVKTCC